MGVPPPPPKTYTCARNGVLPPTPKIGIRAKQLGKYPPPPENWHPCQFPGCLPKKWSTPPPPKEHGCQFSGGGGPPPFFGTDANFRRGSGTLHFWQKCQFSGGEGTPISCHGCQFLARVPLSDGCYLLTILADFCYETAIFLNCVGNGKCHTFPLYVLLVWSIVTRLGNGKESSLFVLFR